MLTLTFIHALNFSFICKLYKIQKETNPLLDFFSDENSSLNASGNLNC